MLAASDKRCETPGCSKLAVCRHHIFTVGRWKGKARVEINEFYCCADHHTLSGDSWHKGRDTFAKKHNLEGRVGRARKAVCGW